MAEIVPRPHISSVSGMMFASAPPSFSWSHAGPDTPEIAPLPPERVLPAKERGHPAPHFIILLEGQDTPPPCHAPSATHSNSPDSERLIICILFVCEKLTPQRCSETPATYEAEDFQPSVVGAKGSNPKSFFNNLPQPSLWNSHMGLRSEVPLLR